MNDINYDEEYDTQEDFYRDAQVIIHELIHQYFGNLVTPDWWDEGWMKEALTVLYEFLIIQEVYQYHQLCFELFKFNHDY